MPSVLRTAMRGRRELLVIGAVCLAVIAGVWLLSLERISYEREDAIKDVLRQNANLALAFEEQTLHAIRRADLTLLHLKREYEREGRIANLQEVAAEGGIDETLVPNLLITDVNGQVLVAHGKTGPVNVADRDFFAVHRQDQTRGLWIAKPLAGRVTGRTVISMSRPLIGPDGAFVGVVAVGLDPNYFLESYRRFDVGPDGLIQLVGLDGSVRARRQGDKITFGSEMRDSILLRKAAADLAGSFVSRGQSDGISRFQSYRVLKPYPLVVSVGTSVDYALAEFHSRARRYYTAATAATLCVLAFGVVLAFSLRRRRQAMDGLAASEELHRATFNQAAVGITHTGLDGALLRVNPRFCELMGYSEAEMVGRNFLEFTHPDDRARAAPLMRQLIEATGERVLDVEKRSLRRDGSVIWVRLSTAVVRGADGSPECFVTMVQDITARKQANATLLEQLDELRRFQKVTVERELRMIELEAQIRTLNEKAAA